jgi:uncharacterized small protein (DUF1192 family)
MQVRVVLAALALGVPPLTGAVAQPDFPQTLYWGSGLIDIPVAWASPLSGDFALNYSAKRFRAGPGVTSSGYSDRMNSQFTLSGAALGRLEGGVAFYSSNPEYGFFLRGVLVTEEDLNLRGGALKWFPAVAVGVRNLGKYSHIDRFGAGYEILPPNGQDGNSRHAADSLHQGFDTAPTLYAVATKSMVFNQFHGMGLSLTLGGGNGLFSDDGGLGAAYAKNATGGFFYGAMADFPVTPDFRVNVMAENNAWDFNLGAVAVYRGLRAGFYVTELGAGSSEPSTGGLTPERYYNYRKIAFTLGWQSNVMALVRGDFLQKRAERLAHERDQLLVDINERQQRVTALQSELDRYEAQNLLELEQRRAAVETQLRQEKETLRRLEDRLKRLEQQRGVPPPAKP